MVTVSPLHSIRPLPEVAAEVATLPYDTFPITIAKSEIEKRPLSFLRVDKPIATLPDGTGEYDDIVYEQAQRLWQDELDSGRWELSEANGEDTAYFVYRIILSRAQAQARAGANYTQTGIIAQVQVSDYNSGTIRRHENTRQQKLEDRVKHIKALDAQGSAVFLAYRHNQNIEQLMNRCMDWRPDISFLDAKGAHHQLWRISEAEIIAQIEQAFGAVERLYIADGHHRAGAAAQVAAELGNDKPRAQEFLAILYDQEQLNVLDYNRIVHDLAGLSQSEFLATLDKDFIVAKLEARPLVYPLRNSFQMFIAGNWYNLQIRKESLVVAPADPLSRLDVSILQRFLLDPILQIKDPSTDTRIHYVGGVHGLDGLERHVTEDRFSGEVAFALRPVEIDELFAIADLDLLMPPKSTWFEPKPLSGLVVRPL